MKGDAQVIGHLQAQLKNELTAINQYFLHYRMLKHWGFDKLAKKEYAESIGEMKHADWLMDRIFTLDGLPNLQDLAKIQVGEDVPEILACDLRAEQGAQATIKDGIAHCESVRDYVSRDLLQKILDDTEEHIDFLETQIDLIGKELPAVPDGRSGLKSPEGRMPPCHPDGLRPVFFGLARHCQYALRSRIVAIWHQSSKFGPHQMRMLLNKSRIRC